MERGLCYDSHMHTPLCKHASGEPIEYAERALEVGLRGIIFTCHSPMPKDFWPEVRMRGHELGNYTRMVADAAEAFAGKLDIKLGLESDFFPGMESWLEELHERADFDFILGSVHYYNPLYFEKFWRGDVDEFQRHYFEVLGDAAESGLFDCLAHPDVIRHFENGYYWDYAKLKDAIGSALERIKRRGIAVELNTSSVQRAGDLDVIRDEFWQDVCAQKIPIVLGSDSHQPYRVGEFFTESLRSLQKMGAENVSYFHERERKDLPIAKALASLQEHG